MFAFIKDVLVCLQDIVGGISPTYQGEPVIKDLFELFISKRHIDRLQKVKVLLNILGVDDPNDGSVEKGIVLGRFIVFSLVQGKYRCLGQGSITQGVKVNKTAARLWQSAFEYIDDAVVLYIR